MSVLFESCTTNGDSSQGVYTDHWLGQQFTPSDSHKLTYVSLYMARSGTIGTYTVKIYETDENGLPTGNALASVSQDCSSWSTSFDWHDWTFSSSITVNADTQYVITCEGDGDLSNYLKWYSADANPPYNNNRLVLYDGSNWSVPANDIDLYFKEYGIGIPVDKTYSRSLVAIANNEVWYESSTGTMSELSAANGDLNTTKPLMATEAYQKIFIANKTNLKVADFINIKISTNDAGANPCHKGNILTGSTSNATMIVDYVDAVTDDAAMNVYGYRTSTATFISGETVTGTNNDGDPISFVLSGDEVAGPHWYDWTVFGNDTTNYGNMPSRATLVCLYRGRLVLAGDNNNPHQWWMSKVGDPWNFKYDSNDPLSAVTHANSDVGEIGDVITALIPYKDDYLIFGCANSIWLLIGDPMAGGQLSELSLFTGIWGATSWCIDDVNNLYFLGTDGIYVVPIGASTEPPRNLTKTVLPTLIQDLDLDKDTHRVVLSFDPVNYGIIISKTTLDGGANENYWFDLTTKGLFYETYPDSCGIFSSTYYQATDETYKKFLIGCADGYIREFDWSTKDDATTSGTSTINSYFTSILRLSDDEDKDGKLTAIAGVSAGGESSGSFSDTDGISVDLHAGNDAETVLEDIMDGEAAFSTVSWSGPGKQNKTRIKMRGVWAGLKFYNNTASQTWALEKAYIDVKPGGRIKGE